MSKKNILTCVLTVILTAWCCYALPLAHRMAQADNVTGLDVVLSDPDSRFVTVADVVYSSGIDPDAITSYRRCSFPLQEVETRLRRNDKLQSANVSLAADGRVKIRAVPMVPVARVFDAGKPSYYVNADGKAISAELRYHIDVPVLVGSFDSVHPARRLLPLLDKISGDARNAALVATVMQEPDGNIIIVPNIVGHVVNFGDTSMVDDKFRRLRAFYRHIAPTQGWLLYDTIAVKWRGRVVATRRKKENTAPPSLLYDDEDPANLDFTDNLAEPNPIISAPLN